MTNAGSTEKAKKKPCSGTPTGGMRPSRNAPLRAAVLIGVHVLILGHLTHWWIAGKTLSPVEPSEAMFTLERGELNAGFIFFGLAILSTFIFGRFFCGWGCHIVALQDLCAWMMKKIGVRPRLFRSRILVFAPLVIALYMFVWPTVYRWIFQPELRFPGFENHILKEDFWETFAGWEAIPFLFICTFAVVYFLGAKGFCTYGCPYGAFFAIGDRFAAGQIVADLDVCEKCGHCTANCTSNVQIHKEIQAYDRVVDSGCMKCLDCVSVCPTGALSFGYGKPEFFSRTLPEKKKPKRHYDVSLGEELVLVAWALVVFFVVRGLYGFVPMLMAVGISCCITYMSWKLYRMCVDKEARLHRFVLRRRGKVQWAGIVYAVTTLFLILFVGHSAWIKRHLWWADHYDRGLDVTAAQVFVPGDPQTTRDQQQRAEDALHHYLSIEPLWLGGSGLWWSPKTQHAPGTALFDHKGTEPKPVQDRIAWLHLVLGEKGQAVRVLRRALDILEPSDSRADSIGRILLIQRDTNGAVTHYRDMLAKNPGFHACRGRLGEILVSRGDIEGAEKLYRDAIAAMPHSTQPRRQLAVNVYLQTSRPDDAERELREALTIDADDEHPGAALAEVQRLLATTLFFFKRDQDAGLEEMARARQLAPENLELLAQYAQMLDLAGRADDAKRVREEIDRLRRRRAAFGH